MERRFGFPIPCGPHAAVPGIVTRPQPENRVVVPHRSDHYHDSRPQSVGLLSGIDFTMNLEGPRRKWWETTDSTLPESTPRREKR